MSSGNHCFVLVDGCAVTEVQRVAQGEQWSCSTRTPRSPRSSARIQAPRPHACAFLVASTTPSRDITACMMDDIHAPTVSSGPVSGGYTNGVPKEQLSLQELIAEKDRVEAELKALGQVLDSVRSRRSWGSNS